MIDWLFATLRQYPEIAIFLSLGIGYYVGKFTFKGIGLGSVTATLLAAVVIGQLGITINQPLKAFAFLMFLFAVGYGVGPQFVRGVAKDGLPQALYAVVVCVLCLASGVLVPKLAGYDLGYAAGLYAGAQTISASMGLATDAINRLGLAAEQAKALLDNMPVAYAVTYLFGTVGSAIVIALVGPALLGIDLAAAAKDYEAKHGGGGKDLGGAGSAWHRWELRAFRVRQGGKAVGLRAVEAEAMVPNARVFVERIRRKDGTIEDATADSVIREGDVLAVVGPREVLVKVIGENAQEVDDPELLNVPVEGVDVYVTEKAVDGKTLAELARLPEARSVFLRRITRGATATEIPILPSTTIQRGDILSIVGRTQDTTAITKRLGVPDRATDVADVAFIGWRGHARRADRRAGLEGRRGAADAVHRRRRPHLGARVRLAALDAPVLRAHPVVHRVVHELGRPEHLHRHRRDLGRPGIRERPQDAGHQPVPVGHRGDDDPADPRDVHRQVRVPLPRRHPARGRLRSADHDGVARHGLRSGPQPGARARVHRHLRHRQHAPHDLGYGHHHAAVVTP